MSNTETHDPVTGEVTEEAATVDAVANAAEQQQRDAGQALETIITTKTFLPPGADGDDPRMDPRRTVGMEKTGSRIMLGALAGVVTRIERKTTTWQDKELSSVWLHGRFEATNYATNETVAAPVAILPRAYGDMIENAVTSAVAQGMDPHTLRADLDVEIGVKATGRNIPFAWCLVNFIEDEHDRRLRQLRQRQEARLARRGVQAVIGNARAAETAQLTQEPEARGKRK